MIHYIADKEHYTKVLALCEKVKHDLWIGTADLKDLYVEGGRDMVPFLSVLDKLLKRGVDVRLLHAKEPVAEDVPVVIRCVGFAIRLTLL